MKLLLTRDQRSALIGSRPVFTLVVRADLDPTDRSAIDKYKLADTELYASHEISGGSGLLGLASRFAYKAMSITVTVKDLVNGKKIECKDIVEMLAGEEQIKEAARTVAQVLAAASQFGGEEVVEL